MTVAAGSDPIKISFYRKAFNRLTKYSCNPKTGTLSSPFVYPRMALGDSNRFPLSLLYIEVRFISCVAILTAMLSCKTSLGVFVCVDMFFHPPSRYSAFRRSLNQSREPFKRLKLVLQTIRVVSAARTVSTCACHISLEWTKLRSCELTMKARSFQVVRSCQVLCNV